MSEHWMVNICKTCLKPCILNLRSGQIRVQVLHLPLLHCLCVPLNNAECSESVWNYSSWKRRAVKLHSSIMESPCCQFVFVAELMPTAVWPNWVYLSEQAYWKACVSMQWQWPPSLCVATLICCSLCELVGCHFTLGSSLWGQSREDQRTISGVWDNGHE